jgi:hypothetical protein
MQVQAPVVSTEDASRPRGFGASLFGSLPSFWTGMVTAITPIRTMVSAASPSVDINTTAAAPRLITAAGEATVSSTSSDLPTPTADVTATADETVRGIVCDLTGAKMDRKMDRG